VVQARRKPQPKKKKKRSPPQAGQALFGLGMLAAGVLIGSLSTILWQGTRTSGNGVGSGIRNMMETSRQQAQLEPSAAPETRQEQPAKATTSYDFFTVLPEIEVVVSSTEPEPAPVKKAESKKPDAAKDGESGQETVAPQPESSYMLQAGSYQNAADADRLKATLALQGMSSTIQKISIQGRGDFYRVRLGPYHSHAEMVKADRRLGEAGIKALRLKISRAG
jgi:cell division protein FtsN